MCDFCFGTLEKGDERVKDEGFPLVSVKKRKTINKGRESVYVPHHNLWSEGWRVADSPTTGESKVEVCVRA